MISQKKTADYWFTIEPYVYVSLTKNYALLYNILDGATIESKKIEVIELLRETFQKENCGVVLITEERYNNKDINGFIEKLREKYMGDVIDVSLSNSKPVQLLPFYNFPGMFQMYKKHSFAPNKDILNNLSQIQIHVDHTTNVSQLIPVLMSITGSPTFSIIGNIWNVENYIELLSFFDQQDFPKIIFCSYIHIQPIQLSFENNFSYRISVGFPVDMQKWNYSRQILLHQPLPVEYVFDVSTDDDSQQAERMIEEFQIEKYHLNPVYTGHNIRFFEENVFLTKEDILSTSLSFKDFFAHQSINIFDFGKINIMPDGTAYANVSLPPLGNIYRHSIYDIVRKELEEGKSWFRIRNHAPCNDFVFQWICPPPSSYEITLGKSNLCHVIP